MPGPGASGRVLRRQFGAAGPPAHFGTPTYGPSCRSVMRKSAKATGGFSRNPLVSVVSSEDRLPAGTASTPAPTANSAHVHRLLRTAGPSPSFLGTPLVRPVGTAKGCRRGPSFLRAAFRVPDAAAHPGHRVAGYGACRPAAGTPITVLAWLGVRRRSSRSVLRSAPRPVLALVGPTASGSVPVAFCGRRAQGPSPFPGRCRRTDPTGGGPGAVARPGRPRSRGAGGALGARPLLGRSAGRFPYRSASGRSVTGQSVSDGSGGNSRTPVFPYPCREYSIFPCPARRLDRYRVFE